MEKQSCDTLCKHHIFIAILDIVTNAGFQKQFLHFYYKKIQTTVTKYRSGTPPLFGAKWETTNSININSDLYCGQNVQERKYSPTEGRLSPQVKDAVMTEISLSVLHAMESRPSIQKHLRNVLLLYLCHGNENSSSNYVQVYIFV